MEKVRGWIVMHHLVNATDLHEDERERESNVDCSL
jgi:hypothetical protein